MLVSVPTSVGNLGWREWRRRRREWQRWREGGGPVPQVFVAADERRRRLREAEAQLSEAEIERFRVLTADDVRARAKEVEQALRARAARSGYAGTKMDTEDDDWLKLHFHLEYVRAGHLHELPPEVAERWARRLAAHAALSSQQ
jgi:hypothetical protein